MIPLEPPFRLATAADAAQLADLVNFADEGLPLYLWQGMAEDGQDRGRSAARGRRQRRATGRSSSWIAATAPSPA